MSRSYKKTPIFGNRKRRNDSEKSWKCQYNRAYRRNEKMKLDLTNRFFPLYEYIYHHYHESGLANIINSPNGGRFYFNYSESEVDYINKLLRKK